MKTVEMLKQIKTMLKSRLGLAQMTLEDGETVIEAESFVAGEAVFIVSDDERIALPIGEYTKSDGGLIIVTEEGTIAEVRDDMESDTKEDEEIKEEQLEDVVVEDVPEEAATEIESIVEAVVDVIAPIIAEVKEQVEELKKKLESTDEDTKEKEKMSRQKPARKPMKHNPETTRKAAQTLYSQNAGNHTTKDRVFNKLFN